MSSKYASIDEAWADTPMSDNAMFFQIGNDPASPSYLTRTPNSLQVSADDNDDYDNEPDRKSKKKRSSKKSKSRKSQSYAQSYEHVRNKRAFDDFANDNANDDHEDEEDEQLAVTSRRKPQIVTTTAVGRGQPFGSLDSAAYTNQPVSANTNNLRAQFIKDLEERKKYKMEQRKLAALWSIAAMLVVIAVLFVVLIAVICCKGKRRNFGGMSKDEIILQALALMLKERGVDMSRI